MYNTETKKTNIDAEKMKSIKENLLEGLDDGWMSILKPFVYSDDFEKIINQLAEKVNDGKRFTPELKYIFNAFKQTKYEDLRVVIVGQDPYPQIGVANGVAFCCSRTGKMQPSLRYILEAINHTVYNDTSKIEDPDLSHLSQQGVLLINSALTCEVDKPDSHTDIWKPFTAYLLDMISNKKQGLIFLFLGKQAQKNADLIDEYKHEILFASHPASAAYSKSKMWDCSDCFNKINELLKTKIKWKKDQN